MDQDQLRPRIRAGDPDAFAALFDAHARVIHRHAARVTGDPSLADDIVSLTFLEAWRLRAKVAPEGESLRPWLFGIAVNVLRNSARAARRYQAALARIPACESVPDLADEVVERSADAEELAAAHRAPARLRRPEREVFTLVVWAGLDYAAAAEALGVPIGTLRSRLSRARRKLRDLMAEETQPVPTARTAKGRPPSGGSAGKGEDVVKSDHTEYIDQGPLRAPVVADLTDERHRQLRTHFLHHLAEVANPVASPRPNARRRFGYVLAPLGAAAVLVGAGVVSRGFDHDRPTTPVAAPPLIVPILPGWRSEAAAVLERLAVAAGREATNPPGTGRFASNQSHSRIFRPLRIGRRNHVQHRIRIPLPISLSSSHSSRSGTTTITAMIRAGQRITAYRRPSSGSRDLVVVTVPVLNRSPRPGAG
ncbi:RNA polymerase sigma factor [Embleya sp. NPDC050154]|uniref:RNA polymerase sigma factor n=1 Tax=Embleya sp. NPDC050154 TaxID=3363988 RepID=UPI0037A6CC24